MEKNKWATMLTGANGRISSKRVLGVFILLVLLIVIVICIFTGYEGTWLGEAVLTMMIGSFALLGIGVFEKRFKTPLPEDESMVQEDNGELETIDESQQST